MTNYYKFNKSDLPDSLNNYNTENNAKEPIYYILVTAGVLVAGYFAYKKFKK
jgi:ABC-type polysaccharide/polyol phosphate export permease